VQKFLQAQEDPGLQEEGDRAPDGRRQAIRGEQLAEDLALKRGISVEAGCFPEKKIPVMEVRLHISWPKDLFVPADLLWAYCC
jgi:hypothetical protein